MAVLAKPVSRTVRFYPLLNMDYFEQHEQLRGLWRGTLCHFRVALRIRRIDISNGMGIAGIIAERSEGRPESLSLYEAPRPSRHLL